MKYFNYDNFMKRYGRLERAYFDTYDPDRKEAILAVRKALHRLWQRRYLEGTDR